MFRFRSRQSFTLIELLVVLAIVAILSVVVILTLNPSELLKQARDSNRLSDLSTLNTALSAYSADVNGGFMGTSSVVYVSIPDTTSTCSNLGLPTLPSGWAYNCVTTTSTKLSDGRGWIPVNFSNISFGSPLSSLPVDPVNTTNSRNYYTYISGGSWELSTTLEAAKNKMGGANDRVSTDGGGMPDLYETGNNLTLNPVDYGDTSLVGYWNFEEGAGGALYDRSGNNNTGVWSGTGTRWTTGRIGSWAGQFGTSTADYVQLTSTGTITSALNSNFTISFWVSYSGTPYGALWGPRAGTHARIFGPFSGGGPGVGFTEENVANVGVAINTLGSWAFITYTYDGISLRKYTNGSLVNTASYVFNGSYTGAYRINDQINKGQAASIDDFRVFNRALSLAEIQAIYNGSK